MFKYQHKFILFLFCAFSFKSALSSSVKCVLSKDGEVTSKSRLACLKKANILFERQSSSDEGLVFKENNSRIINHDELLHCSFTVHRFSGFSPKFRCYKTNEESTFFNKQGELIFSADDVDSKGRLIDAAGLVLRRDNGKLQKADKLRIKYTLGKSRHREVFTEVAASHIFAALGFYSDAMSSVKVICKGCQSDPFGDRQEDKANQVNVFYPASVERKLKGKEIETRKDEGWSSDELRSLYLNGSKERKVEIESFLLLANLVGYHNLMARQNRILCQKRDKTSNECLKTIMYIHDLGSTFGGKGFIINPRGDYKKWQSKSVFKDHKKCEIRYDLGVTKIVSENSRRLLMRRLEHVNKEKIKAIFTLAKFNVADTKLRKKISKKNAGISKKELDEKIIDIWVAAYMKKYLEIAQAKCR